MRSLPGDHCNAQLLSQAWMPGFRLLYYLEGLEDLVSRFITPVTHVPPRPMEKLALVPPSRSYTLRLMAILSGGSRQHYPKFSLPLARARLVLTLDISRSAA